MGNWINTLSKTWLVYCSNSQGESPTLAEAFAISRRYFRFKNRYFLDHLGLELVGYVRGSRKPLLFGRQIGDRTGSAVLYFGDNTRR